MPYAYPQPLSMRRRAPELRIGFASRQALGDINLLRLVDGDGHLIEHPDQGEEDIRACDQYRLAHARITRPQGSTMSRAVATVRLRQETIGKSLLGVFDKAVVRYTQRNAKLAALTAAPTLARIFVVDDRPLTALTAVTRTGNKAIVALLTRLGAVGIRPEIAGDIHPALDIRQRQIDKIAREQFGSSNDVIHWGFTAEAIRRLLMLALEATSQEGYYVEIEPGNFITARIEGEIDDPKSRQLIADMATSKIALPVQITRFD